MIIDGLQYFPKDMELNIIGNLGTKEKLMELYKVIWKYKGPNINLNIFEAKTYMSTPCKSKEFIMNCLELLLELPLHSLE